MKSKEQQLADIAYFFAQNAAACIHLCDTPEGRFDIPATAPDCDGLAFLLAPSGVLGENIDQDGSNISEILLPYAQMHPATLQQAYGAFCYAIDWESESKHDFSPVEYNAF